MPKLVFDFTWYKDSKGYRLVPGKPVKRKPGQSFLDAVLDMPMADIQPMRIVRNGGALRRSEPMKIERLFEQFAKIENEVDVLKFVERHGPLTTLRGKGDIVLKLIHEAEDMRRGVSKSLAKLNVSIVSTGGETRLILRPACLLDAIWLQYAQASTRSRRCPQCHKLFLVGAAAGRRKDARYCSDECRVKFNSLERSRRWM